jgi:hypothetical protein
VSSATKSSNPTYISAKFNRKTFFFDDGDKHAAQSIDANPASYLNFIISLLGNLVLKHKMGAN